LEVSVSSHQVAQAQKRRSTRLDHAVPVAVQGVGAYREPYQDQVSTLSISCHGCTYNSKYEVIQGEIVYLDVRSTNDGSAHGSSRARVKWVQNLGGKVGFQIAVELEVAGNIWGIASPPEDWFPVRALATNEAAATGRELRVVARTEQQNSSALQAQTGQASAGLQVQPTPVSAGLQVHSAPGSPTPAAVVAQGSQLNRNETSASPLSSLTQLMAGLGEQMQILATEAARTALAEQKGRLLEDFRLQLRQEAIRAMQSVILASKEDFTRLALKELNVAHEAGARANYSRWMEKIGQDMESARQHMLNQTKEVSQRVDSLAAATVERVQRSMEATRSEAVERFVSRLREQVAPTLAEAKDALQALADSGVALKKESQAIRAGLETQLETATTASLVLVQDQLDQNASAVAAKTHETLLKLSENFESTAREHVQSLLVSMGTNVTKALEERTAEISRDFSAGLEGYTRNYLEFISKAIAEIPKNPPVPSHK
jgi:ethanolamine utilization microcompartment shell protein EutL